MIINYGSFFSKFLHQYELCMILYFKSFPTAEFAEKIN